MADALVSSVLRSLNSIIQPELGLVFSARQELQKLSSAFTAIQAVLRDADRRQVKEEALSNWLEKLKDIAYDVDDLLDEWRAEALRLEIDGTGIPTCGKKVCNFFLRRFCFNEHVDEMVFHLKLGVEMGRKVKTIRERLDMICDENTKFRLDERWEKTEIEERRTSSLIDESEIIGRSRDKERIIGWLLTEPRYGYDELPVGSIVGMGGLGKTTLAQLVYRDDRVIRNFERRIWVHVSQVFDEMRLCKAIIEAVEGTAPPNFLELEMVHIHLRNLMEGRRFLLVLDDMWNESQDKWDKLRLPLIGGASGSRILITTQNETVTKVTGRAFMHLLKPLQEDDCWLLFSRIAILGRSTREQLELEGVGRQITNKCGGVPLVVKRIGNAMRFRRTVREWKLVLESQTWDLPIVARGIVFELQVSYYNMPSHLKQCFAFCSIFPRDHVIEKEMLIKLWMAHGFILPEESGELESVGQGYFDDLLRRSLFEDPMTDDQGNVMHCKMKEIIHDLFRIVMSECHIMHRETSSDVPTHARHFSLVCTEDLASIPRNLYKAKNLRTLLFIGWLRITGVPSNIFESLRCLRVLDLSGTNIKRLPNSLGDMKLLRYLNLSTTQIEELPESISKLFLLQTLKLNECRMLRKLPKGMKKFIKLRHLEIKGTSALNYLPEGIGALSSLRTLSKFIVGDERGCKIEELKDLNHLEGDLEIVNLERLARGNDGSKASIEKKQYINVLSLCCVDRTNDEWLMVGEDEKEQMRDVFGSLRPHENLKELRICNYIGFGLPIWVGDASFHNLVSVQLVNCHLCRQLPPLGYLPSLKYLEIDGIRELQYVGQLRHGVPFVGPKGFPALEDLTFKRMQRWARWELSVSEEQMPCLLQLTILGCPRLEAIPDELGQLRALESLTIQQCTQLKSLPKSLHHLTTLRQLIIDECPFLKESCRKETGGDWGKIVHVPNICIDGEQIQWESGSSKH